MSADEVAREDLVESRFERLGEFASLACAVHCAAMPILIGAGAAGAFSFLRHEPVEWGLVLLAAVVGTLAAWKGFKTHGNLAVVTLLLLAVVAMIAHALHVFESDGHAAHAGSGAHVHGIAWTGIIGGIALAASLFVNNRMCKSCRACAHHEQGDRSAA